MHRLRLTLLLTGFTSHPPFTEHWPSSSWNFLDHNIEKISDQMNPSVFASSFFTGVFGTPGIFIFPFLLRPLPG